MLHLSTYFFSYFVRFGLISNLSSMSSIGKYVAEIGIIARSGSDSSGLYVRVVGRNRESQNMGITWQLYSRDGDGPQVPATPAVLLVDKIMKEKMEHGANVCMEMFSVDEVIEQLKFYDVVINMDVKSH